LSEQQKDFKKIILAMRSQKFTPDQIGSLMKQYYRRHLAEVESKADSYTQTLDDAVKIFDGKVALFNS
jgi:hypothetical protein